MGGVIVGGSMSNEPGSEMSEDAPMRVSENSTEFGSTFTLRRAMSLQASISLGERFDLEAPTPTPVSSKTPHCESEATAMPEPKVVGVVAKTPADCECVGDFVRSAGHTPIGFGMSEDLTASLREELRFDLLLARFDGDGPRLSDEVQALRRRVGTDVPLLLMAREAQLRTVATIASAVNVDFILLPCNPPEFEARFMRLRRSAFPEAHKEGFRWGCYYFDPSSRKVYMFGEEILLPPVEFDLAYLFFRNPGIIYSRRTLFRKIWGGNWHESGSRTLDVHVARLRKKLELGPHRECELLAVYGVGYQLRTSYPSSDDDENMT